MTLVAVVPAGRLAVRVMPARWLASGGPARAARRGRLRRLVVQFVLVLVLRGVGRPVEELSRSEPLCHRRLLVVIRVRVRVEQRCEARRVVLFGCVHTESACLCLRLQRLGAPATRAGDRCVS